MEEGLRFAIREGGRTVGSGVVKTDLSVIKAKNPKGIIFTGGPNSVYLEDSPTIDPEIFNWGVPVLGICYGSQLMMHLLGGHVCRAPEREYGKTRCSWTPAASCSPMCSPPPSAG